MRRCPVVAVVGSIAFAACGGSDRAATQNAPAEERPAEQAPAEERPAEQAPAEQPLDVSDLESSLAETVGGDGGLSNSQPTVTDVSVDCPDDIIRGSRASFTCRVSGTAGEQTPSPGEEVTGTIKVKQSGGEGAYEYDGSIEGGGFSSDISGTLRGSPTP